MKRESIGEGDHVAEFAFDPDGLTLGADRSILHVGPFG
jgi:hypothetical protein